MQRVNSSGLKDLPLTLINIPFVPIQVDLDDLDRDNYMLYSKEEIDELTNLFKKPQQGLEESTIRAVCDYRSRKKLNDGYVGAKKFRHHVVRLGDDLFAIYKGAKSGSLIGRGEFGRVKAAQKLTGDDAGTWCALKVLDISHPSKASIAIDEAERLKSAEKLIATYMKSGNKATQHHLMDYAPGVNLEEFNNSRRGLSSVLRLRVALDLIETALELHQQNHIVHVDIKDSNVHFDPVTEKVTLVDYSLSLPLNKDGVATKQGFRGTRLYTAPEVFVPLVNEHANLKFSQITDTYSLGVTLARWFGYVVKRGEHLQLLHLGEIDFIPEIVDQIEYGNVVTRHLPEVFLPHEATRAAVLNLIKKMTFKDPSRRISLESAITQLRQLIENYLYLPARINQIALVNVSELKFDDVELMSILKKFDQIWLVESAAPQANLFFYLELRRELEKLKYTVGSHVFNHPRLEEGVKQIPNHEVCKNMKSINNYFFITRQYVDFDYGDVCSIRVGASQDVAARIDSHMRNYRVIPSDLEKVKNALNKEIQRLWPDRSKTMSDTVIKSRVNAIEKGIELLNDLSQRGDLTYKRLIKEIDNLQGKMGHTGMLGYLPIFQPPTTGANNISRISGEIETSFQLMRPR